MAPLKIERQHLRRSKSLATRMASVGMNLLLVLFSVLPVPTYCQAPQQDQPKEALGSLTGVGEVYLNGNPATGESTIFSGDRIRTGDSGAASFVMSGKGTLKIAPQSQVVFTGDLQFTAELEAGTIALNTITGPSGLSLRIGNYVVVPYSRKESTTIEVTRTPNGAVIVACVAGTAGLLTVEGQVGQYLQAGQSMTVSDNSSFLPEKTTRSSVGSHAGWILGGLGAAGAAAALAFLAGGNTARPVSPSAP